MRLPEWVKVEHGTARRNIDGHWELPVRVSVDEKAVEQALFGRLASDRVRRDGDGGPLTDVREVLDEARPRCPWCEDELDDAGECSRKCRASRVAKEG